MELSNNGKKLIKSFEGLSLCAYYDVGGIKTIGYGHTGKSFPDVITIEQADKYFDSDVIYAEKKVMKYQEKYHFSQTQFDALVSFAFNIGEIDQLTDNGNRTIEEISKKILRYCNVNHNPIPGLVNRRQAEKVLFDTGDYNGNKNI